MEAEQMADLPAPNRFIDCCTRRLPDRENHHIVRVHFSFRRQSFHGYFRLLALNAGQDV